MELNLKNSDIGISSGLLFVLSELTGHSTTKIMGYFMDRGREMASCPSNVFEVSRGRREPVVDYSHGVAARISVLRGFYPGTCIGYKLCAFISSKSLNLWVSPLIDTKQKIITDLQKLSEAVAEEMLLGDATFNPPLAKPRVLTPTGATPQPYRKKDKKRRKKT